MARKAKGIELEKSLDTLETLVEQMESGDLSLEESLEAFERGIKLTRECQQALKQAEQKVRILTEQSETAEPEPLEGADDDADEQ
jgi:exodeoxyribonuclease VII small subunit